VSPDERTVDDLFTGAVRRGRTLAVIEGLAWGTAAAALSPAAGVAVAAIAIVWRLRTMTRRSVVRLVDRATPDARNLLVTADELRRGHLSAKPEVRARVLADAGRVAARVDVRSVFPATTVFRAAAAAAGAWLFVAAGALWRTQAPDFMRRMVTSTSAAGSTAHAVHVTVAIDPPGYTGLARQTVVDPSGITAVEGSALTIAVDGPSGGIAAEHDGAPRPLRRDAAGRFVDRIDVVKTGYYSVAAADGARRVMPIVVAPDALPSVRISTPGRDLVYPSASPQVSFEAHAIDDYGLRSLALQYTRMTGSSETYQFEEGEIPLTIVRSTNRDWKGTATRSLADLRLNEGDVLVYRAVASDARGEAGAASSDAFFIEISTLAAAAGDAFTVPQEETRYALSEQMLVIKTERLDRDRSAMPRAGFEEAALNLSLEQRTVRAEFVFMLGGEIEDEEVEAAQATELAEGRLQNRGQRDLRLATVAMSEAEKLLTGGSTHEALAAERRAIAALQRAFVRDRYILRALAGQTDLDPARRLTGIVGPGRTWRRDPPATPENRRAALLQDLLSGIGELRSRSLGQSADVTAGGERGNAGRGDPAQIVLVLAREALRIDPESAALRTATADLQRLGDSWSAIRIDTRRQTLDDIAAGVARELSRALAGPAPHESFVAPSLAGAVADGLGRRGPR